jgi:hypothetical protein
MTEVLIRQTPKVARKRVSARDCVLCCGNRRTAGTSAVSAVLNRVCNVHTLLPAVLEQDFVDVAAFSHWDTCTRMLRP